MRGTSANGWDDPFIRKTTPLSVQVTKPKATWVDTVMAAEGEFTAETGDGLLREAVFKGLWPIEPRF